MVLLAAQNLALAPTAIAQSAAVPSNLPWEEAQPRVAQPVASVQEPGSAAVNINAASASELASLLNGVGARKAEAIVRHREQFGPFESVDELSEVAGIGTSTVERNRTVIRLQ